MPDRDAYDQLVREFKEAGTEEIKRRVTERLERDQKSDNSLIRYYAVRAMTKLDTALFSSALQPRPRTKMRRSRGSDEGAEQKPRSRAHQAERNVTQPARSGEPVPRPRTGRSRATLRLSTPWAGGPKKARGTVAQLQATVQLQVVEHAGR